MTLTGHYKLEQHTHLIRNNHQWIGMCEDMAIPHLLR